MRLINSNNDDLNVLITKGFAIPFDDGIILITHWNVNNIVREDREATSQFVERLEGVLLADSGTYQLLDNSGSTPAQIRLDKIRLDEVRLGESKDTHTTFKEVESFLEEIASKYEVPLEFVRNSYDTAGNWIKAKGRVYKDYRAFFENWVKRDKADWLLKVRKQHNGIKIAHYQE